MQRAPGVCLGRKGWLVLWAMVMMAVCWGLAAPAQGATHPWPRWHYNNHNTGLSHLAGPSNPQLLWKFYLGDTIDWYPVVDQNGVIYFTGYNRTEAYTGPRLYAVNPDGTEKWHKDGNWNFQKTSPTIAPDGTLYVWGDFGDASLYALNSADGSQKWKAHFGDAFGPYQNSVLVGPDGAVYAYIGNSELVALNPLNGAVIWQKQDLSYASPLALAPGGAYLYCGSPMVRVSTATGEKDWTSNAPAGLTWLAVAPDGTVYASGMYSTDLVAIDPVTGNQLWLYNLGSHGGVPTIVGDTLYLFCRNATLHAVNRLTGAGIWVFDQLPDDMGTEEQTFHAPVVDKDGIIYLATRSNGVLAITPDKLVVWNYRTISEGGGSLAVIGPNNRIYYYDHYNLVALGAGAAPPSYSHPWPLWHHDSRNAGQTPQAGPQSLPGNPWKFYLGDGIYWYPVVDKDGAIYFAGYNRTDTYTGPRLYALNPNGTEKWHKDGNWDFTRTGPTLAPDGTLYVWGNKGDAYLYALNPANGAEKWAYHSGSDQSSYFSPVVGPDGTIYAYEGHSWLVALSAANGMVKWNKQDSSYSGPVALSPDGAYLYCGYAPVCVSTATGEKVWTANPPGNSGWVAVAPDGIIYSSGMYSTDLAAIDPATGNRLWLYDLASNGGVPTIAGDTVYLFCRNATLHAVNRLTGAGQWIFDQLPNDMGTEEQVTHAPVVDKDGIIYLASRSMGVWALNPDKSVRWNYFPPPGLGSGGLAVIGTQNRLYYRDTGSKNLMALGWGAGGGGTSIFSLLLD